MTNQDLIKSLSIPTPSKIVLLVIDGLGGLPNPKTGKTELETAKKPNLDKLAAGGICGLSDPVGPGITPGSAPGHLALFGYDPVACNIGRGALEAVGIDFDLRPGDVAARGNFCTMDKAGNVTDRRAGRIPTEKCAELCKLLDGQTIDKVKIFVQPVQDYRFIAVFCGDGLSPALNDTDSQHEGVPPLPVNALSPEAKATAAIANQFIARARTVLAKQHPANMILLRGFSEKPNFPSMQDIYKLKSASIAAYPMYRGLARLVGMEIPKTGAKIKDEFKTLSERFADYDFIFMHIKPADSAGEDGDFDRKVAVIEELDSFLPQLTALKPDVLVVTGDHSTPAMLKGHSWHPVPVLLSARYCRPDKVTQFGESACITGGLGRLSATQIMPLAMANALKLNKFGA
ncbi:MAG: phosphoglycerate mutase [Chloroflexi bacterium RBG_16_51_9]|nr:MAG: phosphoglycerate mutase [Chloroflexi bacterium RBG_16_51_9]